MSEHEPRDRCKSIPICLAGNPWAGPFHEPLDRCKIEPAVLQAIEEERERQEQQWPGQQCPPAEWHLILSEEHGELAQAILRESNPGDDRHGESSVKEELIQVAAVAVRWLEAIKGAADETTDL